jgi:hypothetical protein
MLKFLTNPAPGAQVDAFPSLGPSTPWRRFNLPALPSLLAGQLLDPTACSSKTL